MESFWWGLTLILGACFIVWYKPKWPLFGQRLVFKTCPVKLTPRLNPSWPPAIFRVGANLEPKSGRRLLTFRSSSRKMCHRDRFPVNCAAFFCTPYFIHHRCFNKLEWLPFPVKRLNLTKKWKDLVSYDLMSWAGWLAEDTVRDVRARSELPVLLLLLLLLLVQFQT